jgi:hypothetical protein
MIYSNALRVQPVATAITNRAFVHKNRVHANRPAIVSKAKPAPIKYALLAVHLFIAAKIPVALPVKPVSPVPT